MLDYCFIIFDLTYSLYYFSHYLFAGKKKKKNPKKYFVYKSKDILRIIINYYKIPKNKQI